MALNNIEKLIQKYENGETSLAEESALGAYFQNETIPSHLLPYKSMFAFYKTASTETYEKPVFVKTKTKVPYKWLGVAAMLVFMIGFYVNNSFKNNDLGTFNEDQTELAYDEFKKSLELISTSYNKGISQMQYINTLQKGKAQIGHLNQVEQTTSKIFKTKQ